MKKIIFWMCLLGMLSSAPLQSQVLLEEGFESNCSDHFNSFYLGCHENWISTNGSADTESDHNGIEAAEGVRYAHLEINYLGETCSSVANRDQGEGIAFEYPFEEGATYSISFKVKGFALGSFQWILTNDLNNVSSNESCDPNGLVPEIPSEYFILPPINSNSSGQSFWSSNYEIFIPDGSYNQLWLRASNDQGVNASTDITRHIYIDDIKIEVIDDCVYTMPELLEPTYSNGLTTLNWTPVHGAVSYTIEIKPENSCTCGNTTAPYQLTSTNNFIELDEDLSNSCFFYAVSATCPFKSSAFTEIKCYIPPCLIVDFSLPDDACYKQEIILTNNSTDYQEYRIEVCHVDNNGNCIGTLVEFGDWMSGALTTIDIEEEYRKWRGQPMWCGYSTGGSRLYKVRLYLRNDCGEEVLEKNVLVTCAPVNDVDLPETVCVNDEIPLIDNSLYYSSYKINICRIGADGKCLKPGGNYITSDWQEGTMDDIDLQRDYQKWAKIYTENPENGWKLWCGQSTGTYARYKVAIALKDDCGRTTWKEHIITVICEPCELECVVNINQIPCTRGEKESASTQIEVAGDKNNCTACFEITGPGVVMPLCNLWQISTDVSNGYKTFAVNTTTAQINEADYPGATEFNIRVVNCLFDKKCQGGNIVSQTFYDLCAFPPEEEKGGALTKPRLSSPEFSLGVHPNPFSNSLEVSYSLPTEMPVQFTLFDLSGKMMKIKQDQTAALAGNHQFNWNTEELPAGVYFLHLKAGTFSEVKKIIKIQ